MAKKGKKHNGEKCFKITQKVAIWGKGDKACEVIKYEPKITFAWAKTPKKAVEKLSLYIGLESLHAIVSIEKC